MSGVDTAYARVVVGSALLGVNAPSFLVWAPPFIPGVVRGHGILEVHKVLVTQRVLYSRGPKRGGKPPEKASLDLRSDEVEFPCLIDFVEDFAGRHGLPESELSRMPLMPEELFTNVVKYGCPGDEAAETIGGELVQGAVDDR